MTQLVNKANDCKRQWRVLSAFVSATTAASLSQLNDRSVSLISSRFASVQSNDFKIWRKIDRMKTNCFAACYQSKTLHSSWNNGKLSIQLKGLWSFNSVNTKDPHRKLTKVKKSNELIQKQRLIFKVCHLGDVYGYTSKLFLAEPADEMNQERKTATVFLSIDWRSSNRCSTLLFGTSYPPTPIFRHWKSKIREEHLLGATWYKQ